MSNSRDNAPLTEKQNSRIIELEYKSNITDKQREEYAELYAKREASKKTSLGDTAIEYLTEVYFWERYQKRPLKEQFEIQQMTKGKLVEEESITLLSIVEGVLYEKNNEQIENDFLRGEPDVYIGQEIMQATKITDIKSCWDAPIFGKKINQGLDNGYKEQVQGYMDITGAQEGEVAYCLVDMPMIMQGDFKKKLFYSGEYISDESPTFLKDWNEQLRSMTFNDMPHHERVFRIKVDPFSDFDRQKVYDRVKYCREWLNNFDEMFRNMNIVVPLNLQESL
jgi:hypothetical protein